MSDLIIKPSGTSANFKVQNPSGTDKIVMNSSGTITSCTLGSGVTFPTGHIIQIKRSYLKDQFSYTGGGFDFDGASARADGTAGSIVDDLTITITKQSGTSYFILAYNLNQTSNSDMDGGYHFGMNIYSSVDSYADPVSRGNFLGSRTRLTDGWWAVEGDGQSGGPDYPVRNLAGHIEHSPGSAANTSITYKLCIDSNYTSGGNTVYIGRKPSNDNNSNNMMTVSSLLVMEVQGT